MTPSEPDFPPGCALIEVHVADLKQMFQLAGSDAVPRARPRSARPRNSSPAGRARFSADKPLGLLVHVDKEDATADRIATVHERRARLFRGARVGRRVSSCGSCSGVGRTSLLIGLVFLAVSIVLGDVAEGMLRDTRFAGVARESLLIGGWVAMWRPLEVFLYDWWPIRAEARLFDRLSAMAVRVVPSRSS